jgi:hypothetical protein
LDELTGLHQNYLGHRSFRASNRIAIELDVSSNPEQARRQHHSGLRSAACDPKPSALPIMNDVDGYVQPVVIDDEDRDIL